MVESNTNSLPFWRESSDRRWVWNVHFPNRGLTRLAGMAVSATPREHLKVELTSTVLFQASELFFENPLLKSIFTHFLLWKWEMMGHKRAHSKDFCFLPVNLLGKQNFTSWKAQSAAANLSDYQLLLSFSHPGNVRILWEGRNMATCNTFNETEGKGMGILGVHVNFPKLYGRQWDDKFLKQTKQYVEKCGHESSAILICSHISP